MAMRSQIYRRQSLDKLSSPDRLDQMLSEAFTERVASVGEDIVREAIKDLPIPVDEGGDKLKGLGSFYRTFGGAPVAIVVSVPKDDDPWIWKNYISDASAAIENIPYGVICNPGGLINIICFC